MARRGTILSGMRPTHALHLGNYEGALRNWVRLQDDYDCYFEIADWHAMTDRTNDETLEARVRDVALDWLAAGIDPARSVVFRQSEVKEHAELHFLLSTVTPVGWLERVPTYKDQVRELALGDNVSYAFLGYPVLQAADILAYRADTVPVGKDQVAHLELTREIARRFNHLYGQTFPEPRPLVPGEEAAVLPGLDGRKMSKSYGNAIAMADDEATVGKKVMAMVTDPKKVRLGDPGTPEVCSVYGLHRVYSRPRLTEIAGGCRSGTLPCTDCKRSLISALQPAMDELRGRKTRLAGAPGSLDTILRAGAARARARAADTLRIARRAMRLPE